MSERTTGLDTASLRRREFLSAGAVGNAATAFEGTGQILRGAEAPAGVRRQDAVSDVAALTFDVFGTVVDWRTSIIREGRLLSQQKDSTWTGQGSRMSGDPGTARP